MPMCPFSMLQMILRLGLVSVTFSSVNLWQEMNPFSHALLARAV